MKIDLSNFKLTPLAVSRLTKMVKYLRTEIDDEHFDFGTIRSERRCGTVGCVYGHSPEVFPEEFHDLKNLANSAEDRDSFFGTLVTGRGIGWIERAAQVFDLPEDVAEALLSPNCQARIDMPLVCSDAKIDAVCDYLEAFIEKYK